jgi:hypothetical protein
MIGSAAETPALVPWLFGALAIIGIGAFFRYTPAKHHLAWDRRTGYWIYQRELKKSGDEELALEKAACFYRVFGLIFMLFGGLHVVVVATVLIYSLCANQP